MFEVCKLGAPQTEAKHERRFFIGKPKQLWNKVSNLDYEA